MILLSSGVVLSKGFFNQFLMSPQNEQSLFPNESRCQFVGQYLNFTWRGLSQYFSI
jgi:hypothetical protein